MSRAFVKEDGGGRAHRRVDLPPRDDPGFDEAAARALLQASLDGDTESAEVATGYYWGERSLRPLVEGIRAAAHASGDDALERAAARFLR